MKTFHKLSVIVLVPACGVMATFFLIASGIEVGGEFLQKAFAAILIVSVVLGLAFMIGSRRMEDYEMEPEPLPIVYAEPVPEEDEQIEFQEIRGSQWTRNFVSQPDRNGNVIAMFIRRADNEKRVVEPTDDDRFVIYRVEEDDSWRKVTEIDADRVMEYVDRWAKTYVQR